MSSQTDIAQQAATITYDAGNIGFTIFSMALVWLMIPGIGYFYSGMAREKNALSLIVCSVLSLVVVSVQVTTQMCNDRDFTHFQCSGSSGASV